MTYTQTDNFDRANANPIGGNWVTVPSNSAIQIVSNAATPSSLAADCSCIWTAITSFPTDQYSQAAVTVTGTVGGNAGMGVIVRGSKTANTYYRLCIDHAAASNVFLGKKVAGTSTAIWTRTQAFTDGDILRLEVRGNILRALLNGVAIGADVTDNSILGGYPGLHYSSTETAASADTWQAGSLGMPFYSIGLRPAIFKPGIAR